MKSETDVDSKPDETDSRERSQPTLVDGLDYYLENGLMVFTAYFLLRRGYCCDSGCRHCPYEEGQYHGINTAIPWAQKFDNTSDRGE